MEEFTGQLWGRITWQDYLQFFWILRLRNWTHRNSTALTEGKGAFERIKLWKTRRKKKKHGETLVSYKHFYFRCLNCTNGSVSQDPVLSHSAAWVSPYSLSCKKDTWPPRAESLSRTAIGHVASLRLSSGIWKKFSYLIWPHLLLSVTLEIKILSHSYPR